MSIQRTPLHDVEDSATFKARAQDNFEFIGRDLYANEPTYQSGVANTITGPPTTGAHTQYETWRDQNGALFICTVDGTPGTWKQRTPAVVTANPSSPTTGYWIVRSDLNFIHYYWDGAAWTPVPAGAVPAGAITFAMMQAVSANVLLGNDASGTTVEEITCTGFARTILDDTDAATARTTLGLGTVATLASDTDATLAAASNSNVATQAAVKSYVDNAITGLKWKAAVEAATTADVTLSGEQTIDGVALVAGDRVLVKNQSTASQNGIYVVAAGAWSRSTDADTGTEVRGCAVLVMQGSTYADTQWANSNTGTITLGSTSVTFAQFGGAGTYTADGTYLSLSGNQFTIADAELKAFAGLTSASDKLGYFTGAGTMSTTDFSSFGRSLVDDADASAARTTLGLGTMATQAASSVSITGGSMSGVAITGGTIGGVTSLSIVDAVASGNKLVIAAGSTLTAERTLTITTGDSNRTLTMAGDATISGTTSGTNTGDQTITLTGDVTGSGTGSFAATIANSAVTNAKLADMTQGTIKGRADSAGTGAPSDLTGSQVRTIIGMTLVDTVFLGAGAGLAATTNGPSSASVESTTNKVNYDTFDFDASTNESIHFPIVLPPEWDGGTIKAKFHWTVASGSGNVIWGIQAVACSDDDAIDTAFGTAQTVTDTVLTAGDVHTTSATAAVTIGNSPAAGDVVFLKVYRDAAAGGDTLAVDARLIGVSVQIGLTQRGSTAW